MALVSSPWIFLLDYKYMIFESRPSEYHWNIAFARNEKIFAPFYSLKHHNHAFLFLFSSYFYC